ncbi:MAG: response regulator transcription factor [Sphingobium sp.]|nr:response regulator transcription factor [Sphingobium sp.]
MNTLRVLCADDEALALRRLQLLLARIPSVDIVGTARNGPETLADVARLKPDILLLDIRMGQMSGLEVAETLIASAAPPHIIFVTAFDEFALRAFDLSAVDYLVKPVELGRLEQALTKARAALEAADAVSRAAELEAIIAALRETRRPMASRRYATEFWAQRLGELVCVRVEDIDWIEAERDYVHLHVGERSYLLRETISGLESRLDPASFLRIRRSALVRSERVGSIRRAGYGDYRVLLHTGVQLRVGRTYLKPFRARLTAWRGGASVPLDD